MQTAESMQMTAEAPPQTLTPEWLPRLPSFVVSWKEPDARGDHPGTRLEIGYGNKRFTFAAEYRKGWNERDFQSALAAAFARANRQVGPGEHTLYPLIVLPYLSEEKIAELERQQISGLDYCGNGLILVPDHWLIRATGQPNRFRREQVLQNPYLGKASLVGRALFTAPIFRKLEDLHQQILARGGDLSLAMVSRTLQRLEEEVITLAHDGYKVRLKQPEKLLDALQRAYLSQRSLRLWQGRVDLPDAELLPALFARAREINRRLIVTGLGSATRYAVLAMEKTVRVYVHTVTPPELLLQGLKAVPGPVFPNVEIYAAPDSTVYFDGEPGAGGIVWASPLQAYLEMKQQRESRMNDSAAQVKTRLLAEAHRRKSEIEAGLSKKTT